MATFEPPAEPARPYADAATADLVRELGADQVLAHDAVLPSGQRWDVVFDASGHGRYRALRPALAPRTAASGVSMNLDGLKQKAKDVRAAIHQPWRAKIQRRTRPPDPFLTARSSTRSSASGTR